MDNRKTQDKNKEVKKLYEKISKFSSIYSRPRTFGGTYISITSTLHSGKTTIVDECKIILDILKQPPVFEEGLDEKINALHKKIKEEYADSLKGTETLDILKEMYRLCFPDPKEAKKHFLIDKISGQISEYEYEKNFTEDNDEKKQLYISKITVLEAMRNYLLDPQEERLLEVKKAMVDHPRYGEGKTTSKTLELVTKALDTENNPALKVFINIVQKIQEYRLYFPDDLLHRAKINVLEAVRDHLLDPETTSLEDVKQVMIANPNYAKGKKSETFDLVVQALPDLSFMTDLDYVPCIRDSRELRNINSYEYLRHIVKEYNDAISAYQGDPEDFIVLKCIERIKNDFENPYHPNKDYGEMYTQFMIGLQAELKKNLQFIKVEETPSIDNVIIAIYNNPNQAIERAAKYAEYLSEGVSVLSPDVEKIVGKGADPQSRDVGYGEENLSPTQANSGMERFKQTFVPRAFVMVAPMTTTNIPSEDYSYLHDRYENEKSKNGYFLEDIQLNQYYEKCEIDYDLVRGSLSFTPPPQGLRLGTQVQQLSGEEPEMYPSFQALEIVRRRKKLQEMQEIQIYFNFLTLDRKGKEGENEREFARAMHAQESESLLVITLPADRGLLDHSMVENKCKNFSHETSREELEKIIKKITTEGSRLEDRSEEIRDFYISDRVKKLLYGTKENGTIDTETEAEIINKLMARSFEALGLQKKDPLTQSEVHAVYFHLMKYEYPNFILTKLRSLGYKVTYNKTCKDAIDRGRIAEFYFRMVRSMQMGMPLTQNEAWILLHGASTMVKGRGMNDHLERGLNALYPYLIKNPTQVPEWIVNEYLKLDPDNKGAELSKVWNNNDGPVWEKARDDLRKKIVGNQEEKRMDKISKEDVKDEKREVRLFKIKS